METTPIVCDQPDHIDRAKYRSMLELERIQWATDVQDGIKRAIRACVSDGTLTRDEALETYNKIAFYNGWAEIEAITSTYTVEVTYYSDVILTVEGVEADDEDSACNEVLENLEIDNVKRTFDVSYGDTYDSAEVWVYDNDFTDGLSAQATEE